MFTQYISQVLLSGLTQLTKVSSEHKKPLGMHSTCRKKVDLHFNFRDPELITCL